MLAAEAMKRKKLINDAFLELEVGRPAPRHHILTRSASLPPAADSDSGRWAWIIVHAQTTSLTCPASSAVWLYSRRRWWRW